VSLSNFTVLCVELIVEQIEENSYQYFGWNKKRIIFAVRNKTRVELHIKILTNEKDISTIKQKAQK
jgi:hypothetical protein